jgi:hypothetical protein
MKSSNLLSVLSVVFSLVALFLAKPIQAQENEAVLFANDPESKINIRSEPTTNSSIVYTGKPGELITLLGDQRESSSSDSYVKLWYSVRTSSGVRGWVRGDLIGQKEFNPINSQPMKPEQLDILSRYFSNYRPKLPKLSDFLVAQVDLNNDRVPEYILTGNSTAYCGSRGCSKFVVDLQGKEIAVLWGRNEVVTGNLSHNGYKEIGLRYSGNPTLVFVFTFQGGQYKYLHIRDGKYKIAPAQGTVELVAPSPQYSLPFSSAVIPGTSASCEYDCSRKPVWGRTSNFYLVQPCEAGVCYGSFYYLPANVVRPALSDR